ncbi:MAG: hypothetical protein AMXMBFR46_13920 [Acidimicrobiia bacterium]
MAPEPLIVAAGSALDLSAAAGTIEATRATLVATETVATSRAARVRGCMLGTTLLVQFGSRIARSAARDATNATWSPGDRQVDGE